MTDPKQTIEKERASASFPSREMTYFYDGGKDLTEYREAVMRLIERDSELHLKDFFDMSRPEAREKCTAQLRRAVEIKNSLKNDPLFKPIFSNIMNSYDRSFGMRAYVHDILFNESIWAQGTPEQWKKWKDDIANTRVLGCFSMTELGHSSFLRGIETTATFDKVHQEFVIDSPTLTSTKWWIGMAGQLATHTVAICQLKIDQRELGLHWFIVPLRCPKTGRLLPGVTVGDIGAKMGRNGLDNGWIQFTNVRIPRDYMLMKWAQVSPDGSYRAPPNPAVAYATLIGERLAVTQAVHDCVGQAVTIAVRYGATRRQGGNDEQLLYFQSHQYTLMPILAGVYACRFVYRFLDNAWKEALALQEKSAEGQAEFLRRTPDMHAITANLKAWYGWWAVDALEGCRRTLGGHGFSAYNAVAGHLADWGVITTGGGDNIVLAQQSAKYLVSSLQKGLAGKKLIGSVDYLSNATQILGNSKFKAQKASDLLNSEIQLEVFQWLSVTLLANAGTQLQNDISSGQAPEEAWNNNMMQLVESSRVHSFYYVLRHFVNAVNVAPQPLKKILKSLSDLFALSSMHKVLAHFLELGYMDRSQSQLLQKQIFVLCKEIRKDAIPLVDSFNYPDWILKAPIGRYDGDIYNQYFKTLENAPESKGVVKYWDTHVSPILNAKL